MHVDPSPSKPTSVEESGPWHKGLTKYHWFVLVVAALGWLFDTMDQQLFNLARRPAMEELLRPAATAKLDPSAEPAPPPKADPNKVNRWSGYSTAIFMLGWAIGGLFFGVLGDKIGRAKTMLMTILAYSFFTGFSAFAVGPLDFALYRFLTGLGVGGEFAVGVALVAEVMPDRARARALGWVQALSAVGNMVAASINIILGTAPDVHMGGGDGASFSDWRIMFLIGALPALLVVFIRSKLKEPERWQRVVREHDVDAQVHAGHAEVELGSMKELFTDPRWRRNAIVGMFVGFAGVVAVWGIGFFSFDLMRTVFGPMAQQMGQDLGKTGADLTSYVGNRLTLWAGLGSLVQNAGAFFGIYTFSVVTGYLGRKPTFAISFVLAIAATAFTFFYLGRITGFWDLFWMLPLMGFCQLSLFGGYAIYFPELFPTRLRSTGTSFCYNVGRLVAAVGPLTLGLLSGEVFKSYGKIDPSLPLRYAGVTMCLFLFIGLIALPFGPETKGKPLPE